MANFLSNTGIVNDCTNEIQNFKITGGSDKNIPMANYIDNYHFIGMIIQLNL